MAEVASKSSPTAGRRGVANMPPSPTRDSPPHHRHNNTNNNTTNNNSASHSTGNSPHTRYAHSLASAFERHVAYSEQQLDKELQSAIRDIRRQDAAVNRANAQHQRREARHVTAAMRREVATEKFNMTCAERRLATELKLAAKEDRSANHHSMMSNSSMLSATNANTDAANGSGYDSTTPSPTRSRQQQQQQQQRANESIGSLSPLTALFASSHRCDVSMTRRSLYQSTDRSPILPPLAKGGRRSTSPSSPSAAGKGNGEGNGLSSNPRIVGGLQSSSLQKGGRAANSVAAVNALLAMRATGSSGGAATTASNGNSMNGPPPPPHHGNNGSGGDDYARDEFEEDSADGDGRGGEVLLAGEGRGYEVVPLSKGEGADDGDEYDALVATTTANSHTALTPSSSSAPPALHSPQVLDAIQQRLPKGRRLHCIVERREGRRVEALTRQHMARQAKERARPTNGPTLGDLVAGRVMPVGYGASGGRGAASSSGEGVALVRQHQQQGQGGSRGNSSKGDDDDDNYDDGGHDDYDDDGQRYASGGGAPPLQQYNNNYHQRPASRTRADADDRKRAMHAMLQGAPAQHTSYSPSPSSGPSAWPAHRRRRNSSNGGGGDHCAVGDPDSAQVSPMASRGPSAGRDGGEEEERTGAVHDRRPSAASATSGTPQQQRRASIQLAAAAVARLNSDRRASVVTNPNTTAHHGATMPGRRGSASPPAGGSRNGSGSRQQRRSIRTADSNQSSSYRRRSAGDSNATGDGDDTKSDRFSSSSDDGDDAAGGAQPASANAKKKRVNKETELRFFDDEERFSRGSGDDRDMSSSSAASSSPSRSTSSSSSPPSARRRVTMARKRSAHNSADDPSIEATMAAGDGGYDGEGNMTQCGEDEASNRRRVVNFNGTVKRRSNSNSNAGGLGGVVGTRRKNGKKKNPSPTRTRVSGGILPARGLPMYGQQQQQTQSHPSQDAQQQQRNGGRRSLLAPLPRGDDVKQRKQSTIVATSCAATSSFALPAVRRAPSQNKPNIPHSHLNNHQGSTAIHNSSSSRAAPLAPPLLAPLRVHGGGGQLTVIDPNTNTVTTTTTGGVGARQHARGQSGAGAGDASAPLSHTYPSPSRSNASNGGGASGASPTKSKTNNTAANNLPKRNTNPATMAQAWLTRTAAKTLRIRSQTEEARRGGGGGGIGSDSNGGGSSSLLSLSFDGAGRGGRDAAGFHLDEAKKGAMLWLQAHRDVTAATRTHVVGKSPSPTAAARLAARKNKDSTVDSASMLPSQAEEEVEEVDEGERYRREAEAEADAEEARRQRRRRDEEDGAALFIQRWWAFVKDHRHYWRGVRPSWHEHLHAVVRNEASSCITRFFRMVVAKEKAIAAVADEKTALQTQQLNQEEEEEESRRRGEEKEAEGATADDATAADPQHCAPMHTQHSDSDKSDRAAKRAADDALLAEMNERLAALATVTGEGDGEEEEEENAIAPAAAADAGEDEEEETYYAAAPPQTTATAPARQREEEAAKDDLDALNDEKEDGNAAEDDDDDDGGYDDDHEPDAEEEVAEEQPIVGTAVADDANPDGDDDHDDAYGDEAFDDAAEEEEDGADAYEDDFSVNDISEVAPQPEDAKDEEEEVDEKEVPQDDEEPVEVPVTDATPRPASTYSCAYPHRVADAVVEGAMAARLSDAADDTESEENDLLLVAADGDGEAFVISPIPSSSFDAVPTGGIGAMREEHSSSSSATATARDGDHEEVVVMEAPAGVGGAAVVSPRRDDAVATPLPARIARSTIETALVHRRGALAVETAEGTS